jgi:copper chaperone NosL
MRRRGFTSLLVGLAPVVLAACGEEESAAAPPPPVALTRDAVGHFCGMTLVEHPGPKAQILLRGAEDRPVWFSSARDAIAFTHLAEEPRAIRAIYVSDMAKAADWDDPGAMNWVEARRASFVLGSSRAGGMGGEEAVPFSDRASAERFAATHGGRVLAFSEVPRDWALGGEAGAAERGQAPAGAGPPGHAH